MPKVAALGPAASLLRVLMLEAWKATKTVPFNEQGEPTPRYHLKPGEFEKQPVDIQDLRKKYPSFQRNL
jgi:hypothetical protein